MHPSTYCWRQAPSGRSRTLDALARMTALRVKRRSEPSRGEAQYSLRRRTFAKFIATGCLQSEGNVHFPSASERSWPICDAQGSRLNVHCAHIANVGLVDSTVPNAESSISEMRRQPPLPPRHSSECKSRTDSDPHTRCPRVPPGSSTWPVPARPRGRPPARACTDASTRR